MGFNWKQLSELSENIHLKTYAESLEHVSEAKLFDGLLGHGLFAEKIPNFLTSEYFLDYFKDKYITNEDKICSKICKNPKDYIRYSNMRNTCSFRPLTIPEPFAYARLCHQLKENWTELKLFFKDKTKDHTHKVSRCHVRNLKNKDALFEMNYKNHQHDGRPLNDIIIGKRFQVKADISKCFNTMYSHAIPWALVGKDEAKQNQNEHDTWYNKIDFFTRNIKYGETNGLLIGPHVSNLLSEIILTAIDEKMCKRGFQYIRYIDDYICYTESYEDAEKFLLLLEKELSKYELSLNQKKSQIKPLPIESNDSWITQLKIYIKYNLKNIVDAGEIQMLMDFTVKLALDNNNIAIINFLIKSISNNKKQLSTNAINLLLKRIHHLVLLYPYLCPVIEKNLFNSHDGYFISSFIQPIARDLYMEGTRVGNYEACSYAIYWALKYNFQFDNGYVKPSKENDFQDPFSYHFKSDSIESKDCIFILLAFLYDKKHKLPTRSSYEKEYRQYANKLTETDFDRYWLFIYEILSPDSLPFPYKEMKKNNISFIRKGFLTPLQHNTPPSTPSIPLADADET